MINENKLTKALIYKYCTIKDCATCVMNNNNNNCELYIILKIIDELKEKDTNQTKEELIKPTYYNKENGISPFEYIKANNLDFFEGNIIKYITRYKEKNGLEDLIKAKTYLDELIKQNK